MTMKKYVLLRANKESGPFEKDELIAHGLIAADLVWIEGESTAWRFPAEIDELKEHVSHTLPQQESTPHSPAIYVSLPPRNSRRTADYSQEQYPVEKQEPVLETNYIRSSDDLNEELGALQEPRSIWSRKILPHTNALNIAAVFIGILFSAVFLKKLVDGLVENQFGPDSTATTIQASLVPVDKVAGKEFQNALVTLVEPKVEKKVLPRPAKPKNIKKQIRVTANEYSTGLFGGINGLELTVANSSPHFVNQVEVEVSYLKPNGEVLHTESFPVKSLRPNSKQTISIPDSKRGKKVTYKVINVYSKQYQSLLKQV